MAFIPCQNCGKEYPSDWRWYICDKCGFAVRINEYYDLVLERGRACPEDIDDWYKWQRSCVREEIADDGFELSLSGSLSTLKTDKLRKAPKNRKTLATGKARLTREGLSFVGKLDGEDVSFDFDAKSVYSLTFSTKGFLEFYYNSEYYMLVPDECERCLIKWTLASEEIHNLYDKKWRSACEDAYGKGEIYEHI